MVECSDPLHVCSYISLVAAAPLSALCCILRLNWVGSGLMEVPWRATFIGLVLVYEYPNRREGCIMVGLASLDGSSFG